MRIIEERKTNFDARTSAVDSVGNPMLLEGFGLVRVVPDAESVTDILAYRLIVEVIAPHFMAAGRRIRISDIESEAERILSELSLRTREIARRLARGRGGRPISEQCTGLIGQVRLKEEFTPSREMNAGIPDAVRAVTNQFASKKLPAWSRDIAANRVPCLDDLDERLGNTIQELKKRRGCYFTMKVLEALSRRIEEERGTARSSAKNATERGKAATHDLSDSIARINEVTSNFWGRLNLFTERGITEDLDQAFVHLEFRFMADVTAETMGAVEQVYEGARGEDSTTNRIGVLSMIAEMRGQLETMSEQWSQLGREFSATYETEVARIGYPRSSFIKLVGEARDRTDLEVEYQELLTRPRLTNALIEQVERIWNGSAPPSDLGKKVLATVREHLGDVAPERSLDGYYADRDRRKLESLVETIGQSKPFCPLDIAVLKRQGIAPEDMGFLIIAVDDIENSVLREELPKVSGNILADDFAATGRDEVVIENWVYGAPIYAYRYIEAYRSDYEQVLRNPTEKSLAAAPNPEDITEIVEPKRGAYEMAQELLVLGIASGLIMVDERGHHALSKGGRSLGNREHTLATITKDLTLRFEALKKPIDEWLGSRDALDALRSFYTRQIAKEDRSGLDIVARVARERFGEDITELPKPRRGRPRKKPQLEGEK